MYALPQVQSLIRICMKGTAPVKLGTTLLHGAVMAFAAALAVPVAAQANEAADERPEISSEEAAAIDRAIALGETIYRYDQAAWHTTDAMLATFDDPVARGIGGWIINPVERGHEALFYRPLTEGFEAVWSGIYDGRTVTSEQVYGPGDRPLTSAEAALAIAGNAPLSSDVQMTRCSEQPFNSVVIPTGNADGGHYVYFLVPQPVAGEVEFGGHYRFEVVDGEVIAHRKFTNSCLAMGQTGPEGRRASMVGIAHILDPVPTEIHVFSMFALGIPVAVITTADERVWGVTEEDGEASIAVMQR